MEKYLLEIHSHVRGQSLGCKEEGTELLTQPWCFLGSLPTWAEVWCMVILLIFGTVLGMVPSRWGFLPLFLPTLTLSFLFLQSFLYFKTTFSLSMLFKIEYWFYFMNAVHFPLQTFMINYLKCSSLNGIPVSSWLLLSMNLLWLLSFMSEDFSTCLNLALHW